MTRLGAEDPRSRGAPVEQFLKAFLELDTAWRPCADICGVGVAALVGREPRAGGAWTSGVEA